MFPLDKFYSILYANLLAKSNTRMYYFLKYTPNPTLRDLACVCDSSSDIYFTFSFFFNDQEPLFKTTMENILEEDWWLRSRKFNRTKILVTSEHSQVKDEFCKEHKFVSWYYFFHGFAALEWYRSYKYYPKVEKQFTKVFISLNHLMTKDRSYRLNLVANYIENNILEKGVVSLPLSDVNGTIKTELFDANSRLSKDAKKLVFKHLVPLQEPIIADTLYPEGAMSADLGLELQQEALWNVVSETIFYHDKLHLTEKIFKPIVARRPFILVAAPGNLAYLKSYGFKSFDRWIDESYDTMQDPDLRIKAVVAELTKLCALSMDELIDMHKDMQAVLDYNFDHFYGEFQTIIVDEMLANFHGTMCQVNNGRWGDNVFPLDKIDFPMVKARMLK
jgi:hypothetical protein